MLINEVLDTEDDEEDNKQTEGKGGAEEEPTVIVEGEEEDGKSEEDSRPARQRAQEGEENLTEDQRREKRRTDRKAQKQRRREFVEHLKQQNSGFERALAEANVRIQKLESGRGDDYAAKIDAALAGAQRRAEVLKAKIVAANEEGKSAELAAAVDELADVKVDIQKINDHKAEVLVAAKKTEAEKDKEAERGEVETRRASRQEIDKAVADNVSIFTRKHPWYVMSEEGEEDADLDDLKDSQLVRRLDEELTDDEGSNPATAAHWIELEARIKEELPHRMQRGRVRNNEEERRPNGRERQRRGPAMGGGSRNGGGGEGKEFVLSKARVEAMKEAGIWEDPVRKKKAIENYRKFDAANKEARN